MNRWPCHWLPLALLLSVPAVAQDGLAALAAALVRAEAPAHDDPDAVVLDLLGAALADPRSPAACFLVEEALRRVPLAQRPAALRQALPAATAGERRHALLDQRLAELRWLLDRAVDGPAVTPPGSGPFAGQAGDVLVAGPFGDGGDHFTGVVFAPELAFPAAGTTLPRRGGPLTVVSVRRKPDQRRLYLPSPPRWLPGCYYALHRVQIAAPTRGFLEVECEGDFEVFVDGVPVLRVETALQPGPARRYVPLRLPAGEHHAMVKTCTNGQGSVAMRWVDSDGGPLGGATEIPAGTQEPAPGERATAEGQPFATALDVFAAAAAEPDATSTLRIAALRCAIQQRAEDLALSLHAALREHPPTDPLELLAHAQQLPSLALPEELRTARARELEERAIAALPAQHHTARIAAARLHEQQDHREDALVLLQQHPAPGPETFAYRSALARRLRFDAEEVPLLRAWAAACPGDPRPHSTLATRARAAGNARGALASVQAALALRPDWPTLLRQGLELALDLDERQFAQRCIDALAPVAADGEPSLERLLLQQRLAEHSGDRFGEAALLAAIVAHADAGTEALQRAADAQLRLGATAAAVACLRQSLAIDADQPAARAALAELGAGPADGAAFAALRRDGDAARTAFAPGDREQTATSTVLIDQRIVEVHADGSWLAETHELRSINDLAGVEEFRTAGALAGKDEVLLVRTIGADGATYVPRRIEGEYAMQRLQPGAFIEWRFRERGDAPGPDALRTDRFWFRAADAPCLRTELVLILPPEHRGELRGRDLPPPERSVLPDGRTVLVYARNDVARLPQERLLPPLGDLAAFAEFGEDAAPFAALREARVQWLRRSRPTPPVATVAAGLLQGIADDRTRLAAVWQFAATEIETGPAESATNAILRKKGSRFLVAVGLLRAAGLRVEPTACIGHRDDLGDGDDAVFATGDRYAMPGAMVTLADGSVTHLFVDSPRHWPLGAVPAARGRSRAFVVRADGCESIELPAGADAVQTLRVAGRARVAGNDVHLQATARIGDVQGLALAERIREQKDDVRKLAARQIAQQLFPGWRVRNAQFGAADPAAGFVLTMELLRTCVQQDGERWVMPVPLPPGKFLATFGDRAERTLPLRIGHQMHTEWDVVVEPGEDRAFVELPGPTFVQMRGLDHLQTLALEAGSLRIRRTTHLEPISLPAAQFGEWLQALTAADRADQATVSFRSTAK